MDRVEINGVEADSDELKLLARANYAHFTSMQARNQAVRGLDLHLKRLDDSTRELFGTGLDPDRVRACLRHALRASPDAVTARVTVFSRHQDAVLRGEHGEPDLAVTTTAPLDARTSPVRLRTTTYERDLPHVKHAGTFGLSHHRRRAVLDGYDDVLFTDRDGRISEASISNIVFFTGDHVIWPEAAVLPGITMQLLRRGLAVEGIRSERRDLRLRDLTPSFTAFLTNSISPAVPVAGIDATALTVDPGITALLVQCYETNPWQPVG
ncbi:aminodeoxychorismate lyase [Streptomyces griseofuscus]|uniref:Aminodeoxychorismate lyase n=1 Tax=Streptomyces griseofuscus TaxID=146922 RepID=A0A426S853_9ACTN|nr:aminodeoxychorismate lyase [Streptomyces griseofuscus]